MADRTVVLSQNGRHAVRGLSVNNPSEFSAYQDDDDDLTYVVDLSAYLDGATITVVTRVPQGVFISNSSNTTTRLTQRLRGFGYVDFKVQTSAGDVEEFRINILRRTGSKVVLGASGGGGTAITDGDFGDIVVSGGGSVWSIDAGVIVDADVNASAAIAPTKLAFTQAGTGASARTVDAKLKEWVSVEDFGAVGNGLTNDTAAFQAAIDYVAGLGGGTVFFTKKHLIDANLTVKDYVNLQGPLATPGELRDDNYQDFNGRAGQLIINSSATITVKDGAAVTNCLVMRKGLTLPFVGPAPHTGTGGALNVTTGIPAFAGTAFTVGGDDAAFYNLMIIGFNKAILSPAIVGPPDGGYERTRCQYVNIDCTNGIELINQSDISYIDQCHAWVFTTGNVTGVSDALTNVRTGTAFRIAKTATGISDWGKFTNCFSYGWAIGFDVNGCSNAQLIGCGADYVPTVTSTSIGFKIGGSSNETLVFGCQAAAQGTGIQVDAGGITQSARIQSCNVWSCDSRAIDVVSGAVTINGCELRANATGVAVATGARVVATGNVLNNNTTHWSISGAAETTSLIENNRYLQTSTTLGEVKGFENDTPKGRVYAAQGNADGYIFDWHKARGTAASPTQANAFDEVFKIRGYAYDNTGNYRLTGAIRVQTTAAPTSTSSPGMIIFSTTPTGAVVTQDQMTIDPSGNVLIGSNSTVRGKLNVSGAQAGTSTSSAALITQGAAQTERANLAFYSTFTGTGDNGPRRAADIYAGFTGIWGTEYLSFGVGNNAASNDSANLTNEKVRITDGGQVGIGATTNLSTLRVEGSFAAKAPQSTSAATYTVAATDYSVRFNGSATCTVTMPSAANFPGRILIFNNTTAFAVNSGASNVVPINSTTAGTAILAATAGKFAMLQSDGTNWITIGGN